MTPEEVHRLVVDTGRLSAALFVVALLGVGMGYHAAVRLGWAYAGAHTIHFAMVAWLAFVSEGANLREIGGWPTALGVGAGFYVLVTCAALAWSGRGGRMMHVVGHGGVALIALAFVATYVPLLALSVYFALPVVGIVAALCLYLARVFGWPAGRPS